MKFSRLGRTDIVVTELGFGGSTIGNLYREVDDETAQLAIAAAWTGGIRYFDTAPHYGLGLSERRLGEALHTLPRDAYVISTKVGRLLVPNAKPTGSDLDIGGFAVDDSLTRRYDYTRDGVIRSLEESLERLDTDRVDIVYIHDPENHMDAALRQAVPALIELRDQGVIGAIGVGMNYVDPLSRFVTETDVDVVMIAGRWTLVDRSAEGLLDACLVQGVAAVAAAPFNSGLLSRERPTADEHFDYGPASERMLTAAHKCADACAKHGTTLPHAALQFPLRHPAVCTVVAGMRSEEHVDSNLRWATEEIDPSLWGEIPAAS